MTIPAGIFKAYDVRGLYPQEVDERVATLIGRALAEQLGACRMGLGMDPRPSSPALGEAFARGAAAAGATVDRFGVVATEMLYYGVASRGLHGGAMITASHNPRQYNGVKLVGEGALPLSGERGMPELARRVLDLDGSPDSTTLALRAASGREASSEEIDLYPAYVRHLLRFAAPERWPAFRVVMDAANGVAGKLAPPLFDQTPVRRVEMYFAVDGTFPHHEPNPLLEENREELVRRVLAEKADVGVAWDGDADRCFFIDETGQFVPGDFVTALLAQALLARQPGAAILYDLRASRAVPDAIRASGGVPLVNRVGHAFFKQRMRREPVLFGGEVSGHYYFRDNYNADSGFLPALLMFDLLASKKATLAELLEPLRARYFISGEINSTVEDIEAVFRRLRERFADGEITELDGVSVDYEHWHFNVRASNTEPLVRLNLGADRGDLMEEKRDAVLSVIREGV
jgi:phosphomannomutase